MAKKPAAPTGKRPSWMTPGVAAALAAPVNRNDVAFRQGSLANGADLVGSGGGGGGGVPSAPAGNSWGQANATADAQVAQTVAAIRQQQALANSTAASRAAQIGALGQQAAQFTQGLGAQTADLYRAALADQQGLNAGYRDMSRADADVAAANAQSMIDASGGQAQVNNQAGPLSNVLYGLGGLTGDVLRTQGLGATAAANYVPVTLAQQGIQGANAAIAAGAQEAAGLNSDITQAQGQRASLATQLFSVLESAKQDQFSNQVEEYKLRQAQAAANARSFPTIHGSPTSGFWYQDPKTGLPRIAAQPQGGGADHYYKVGGIEFVRSADGKITQLPGQDASSTKYVHVGADLYRDTPKGLVLAVKGAVTPSVAAGTARSVVDTSKSSQNHYYTNQYSQPTNQYGVPLKNGQRLVGLPGFKWDPKQAAFVPRAKPGGGSGGVTANEASGLLDTWANGTKQSVTTLVLDPATGKPKVSPTTGAPVTLTKTITTGKLSYPDAVAKLQGLGWSHARAVRAANGYYKVGLPLDQGGRPFTGARAVTEARAYIQNHIKNGESIDQIVAALAAGGLIPPKALADAVAAWVASNPDTTFFGG